MIVVLAFHTGDARLVEELLEWCSDLGNCPNHTALLVADAAVPWDTGRKLLSQAQQVFASASILCTEKPHTEKWPAAANAMWLASARHIIAHVNEPWLWLEPDAIPLRSGWLDALSDAYAKCGKSFMGAIVNAQLNAKSFTYMNGVAVYPPDAIETVAPTMRDPQIAWDVAAASVLVPKAANTALIHCWWGENNLPPTFKPNATGRNAKPIAWIPKEAVLHHRCKDGSLISALCQRLGLKRKPPKSDFTVVLPVCNKDISCLTSTLAWMLCLHGQLPHKALLAYPADAEKFLGPARRLAESAFAIVESHRYRGSSTGMWPAGANVAWQSTAARMLIGGTDWLWLEPDAVPLKANWLDALIYEYKRAGKPFMGPIVPGRGHMNGVGIYPANTAIRCPRAMKCSREAWDYAMRPEMIHDCHDASNLIQHFWGVVNDAPHPFEGSPPHFATWHDVERWIPPNAVLMHRNKDGSLAARLTEHHENLNFNRELAARPALA